MLLVSAYRRASYAMYLPNGLFLSHIRLLVDMPLWARFPANKKSPFHKCSVDELIDLTVGNLEYIKHSTRGTTKWLNVLQGTDAKDSKRWWDAVKNYKLGGWALASMVGWRGGLENVLRSVLTIRDEGGFEAGQDWLHVLGTSTPVWAVSSVVEHCLHALSFQVARLFPNHIFALTFSGRNFYRLALVCTQKL